MYGLGMFLIIIESFIKSKIVGMGDRESTSGERGGERFKGERGEGEGLGLKGSFCR